MGNRNGKQNHNEETDERNRLPENSCVECVQPVQIFSSETIQPGEHVVLRNVHYDHHVIIIRRLNGDTFEVAEVSGRNSKLGILSSLSAGSKAEIVCHSKTLDFEKDIIGVVQYKRRLPRDRTILIARYLREKVFTENQIRDCKGFDFVYDVILNNCEHFATFCATGKTQSVQVRKFQLSFSLFKRSGLRGIGDEKIRNENWFENGILCAECYKMNKHFLDVHEIPITDGRYVNKGDIIRYKYFCLWHEAVVLEKIEEGLITVVLKIAHYAFCGFTVQRTIQEETKTFLLNGKCKKLDYKPPKYKVYAPNEVVRRAESRIGEQFFTFFANDSSHFARWCKLDVSTEFEVEFCNILRQLFEIICPILLTEYDGLPQYLDCGYF